MKTKPDINLLGEYAASRKRWWASHEDHAKASQPSLKAAANVFMSATTSRRFVYAVQLLYARL
jgi:hypothetical protein